MARNAVQPRSRVGNVGRMRRMPAAKRSVTRLSRRERPGRLSTYDLSPPLLLRVLTRVRIQGRRQGYIYSPPISPVVSTPSGRINRLFYSSNVKSILHSRCPPRRRRVYCTQRERERERGEDRRMRAMDVQNRSCISVYACVIQPGLSLVIPNVAECGMKLVLNPPRSDAVERDPRPVTGCRTFWYSGTWASAETRLAGDINVIRERRGDGVRRLQFLFFHWRHVE